MDIKNIFTDEDAVSPVIGVILMVAITVILAAVIGTFVLGLGDQVQNNAPQASFSFDYTNGGATDDVTVVATHDGGATFNTENTGSLTFSTQGGTSTSFVLAGGVSAGDSQTLSSQPESSNVRVVWSSPSGDNTATIASGTTPSD